MLLAACLAAALSGCDGPFFVSETDLRSVLGREYLYCGTPAGVQAFDLDPYTGSITRLSGSPFGGGCIGGLASTPQGTAVYAVSLMADPMYGFSIGPGGTLSVLPGYPAVPTDGVTPYGSSRTMTVSPDGRFAHIVHSGSTEKMTSYSVDAVTGALTFAGALGVGCSPYCAAVDATGTHLYVSRGYPAAILHHSLADGLPTLQAQVASAAAYRMAVHPNGYLYGMVAGPSDKNILAYGIDPASGALTPVSGSPYRLGFGPTNVSAVSLAIDRSGRWLYAVGDDDTLYTYSIEVGTGALTLSQGLGSANGGRVAPSSTGRYVYVAGDVGGVGSVYVYEVKGDGSLAQTAGSPYAHTGGISYDARVVRTFELP